MVFNSHQRLLLCYILSCNALAVTIYFSTISNFPNNGYFNHTQKYISDKYVTGVTPAAYTFMIWPVIYLFQMAWMAYAMTTLCRRNTNGPVYFNPVVLPSSFHLCFIMSCVGNVAFLFAFDQENVTKSSISVIITTVFGFWALNINAKATWMNRQSISNGDLTTIYVLVQNGLDLYFCWTYAASCITIAMVLQYSPELAFYMPMDKAATVALAVFLVGNVIWYVVDLTVYFEYGRNIYSGYFSSIWAVIGILAKNYDIKNPNTMIAIGAICVTVFFLIAKIVVSVYNPSTIKYTKMGKGKTKRGFKCN